MLCPVIDVVLDQTVMVYNHRVIWQNHGYLPCPKGEAKFAYTAWFGPDLGPIFASIMSRIAIHILLYLNLANWDHKTINLALPSFFESATQINFASTQVSLCNAPTNTAMAEMVRLGSGEWVGPVFPHSSAHHLGQKKKITLLAGKNIFDCIYVLFLHVHCSF